MRPVGFYRAETEFDGMAVVGSWVASERRVGANALELVWALVHRSGRIIELGWGGLDDSPTGRGCRRVAADSPPVVARHGFFSGSLDVGRQVAGKRMWAVGVRTHQID